MNLVYVKGFGRITRAQLEKEIIGYLTEALSAAKNGNYKACEWLINKNGVLAEMLAAAKKESPEGVEAHGA